jgi:hypothetical protein
MEIAFVQNHKEIANQMKIIWYICRRMLKRYRSHYALFALLAVLSGCSLFYSKPEPKIIKPPYEPIPNALDREYFRSETGDLIGHYPKDWLQVNLENNPELEDITELYTDEKRANGLVLREIPGGAELRRKVERDGLIAICEESIQLKVKKGKPFQVTKQPEKFETDGIEYSGYEYTTSDHGTNTALKHRVICVSTGVRYYELGMLQLRPNPDNMGYLENFRLLQSVIASLEGTTRVIQASGGPK